MHGGDRTCVNAALRRMGGMVVTRGVSSFETEKVHETLDGRITVLGQVRITNANRRVASFYSQHRIGILEYTS